MTELIKAYGFIGIQQVFVLIFSLVRTKIISTYLGPEGLGVFAQANAFVLLLYQVATFGTGIAASTMIAEIRGKKKSDGITNLILVIWALNTITGAVLAAACIFFAEPLAEWAFNSAAAAGFLAISAVAGFLFIQARFVINLLRGLLEWQSYAVISSLVLVSGIGVIAALVLQLGLVGAVWSLLVIQIINLLSLGLFFSLRVKPKYGLNFRGWIPDLSVLRPVLKIAQPVVLILVLEPLAGFLVRTRIIQVLGVDMNGQYQVLVGISLAYMNFLKEARMSYTMPKASSSQADGVYLTRLQNNNLRLGLYLILPLTILVLAFREWAITLLYSENFLFAANLLLWQFIGDALQILRFNLNFVLVPLKHYRYYLFDGTVYWISWFGLSVLLISKWGLLAVPIAHVIANLILVFTGFFYHYRRLGFKLSKRTVEGIALLFPLTGLSYMVSMSLPIGGIRFTVTAMVVMVIGMDLYRQGIHRMLFKIKSAGEG